MNLPVSLQFKAENLWTYFDDLYYKNKIPGLEELFGMAVSLWESYSSPGAFTSLVTGHHLENSLVPIGEPWEKEEDTSPESIQSQVVGESTENEFQGDHILARSASFMSEALVSKEVAQAVAEGDVGRVYEGIKVSPLLGRNASFLIIQHR
jgi:hypothetical protein